MGRTINGNYRGNTIFGTHQSDRLNGKEGNDLLFGLGGNDTLDGGSGRDAMSGGGHSDLYIVDSVHDEVVEWRDNGIDTVQSSVSYELGRNLEHLTLTGTAGSGWGNDYGNKITGNGSANKLYGDDGNDTLDGGAGNDSLYGGDGKDLLKGGADKDLLSGGDSNDTLDGGSGIDTLLGGSGNDVLTWDAGDAKADGGSGSDTLKVSGGPLDLSEVAGGKVTGIEVLDLRGGGDSEVTLDGDAVEAINGSDTLTIKGSAGDRVVATDAWEYDRTTAAGYKVYKQGGLTLIIQGGVEFESGGGSENADPVFGSDSAEGAVTEDAEEDVLTDSGDIFFDDDQLDGHDAAYTPVQNTLGGTLVLDVTSPTGEADGSIGWTYSVDNESVQHLGEGDSVDEVFTILLTDGNGGQAEQTLTVHVTGVNDAADIGGTETGSVVEDVDSGASGTLTVNDVDTGESAFTAVSGQASDQGWGDWSMDAEGNWTYTADDEALQALSGGETATDSFTVTSVDGTEREITISITGTADAAVIGGEDTGSVVEDGDGTASGALTIADADAGDAAFSAQSGVETEHGTFSIDAEGDWTYALAEGALQSLGEGETTADVITVTSLDGTSHDVTITITGTNDAPVTTGESATISEDASVSGSVVDNTEDVDNDVATEVTYSVVNGAPPAGLTFNPDGSYVFNAAGHYDSLTAGDSPVISFDYQADDGDGVSNVSTVSITINGANDRPSGTDTTVAVPASDTQAVYTFSAADFGFTDVDAGDALESVLISTLPAAADGVLRLNGSVVSAGQEIAVGSIGLLTFTQATGASDGSGSFTFRVRDDSNAANDLDSSANTLTITLLDGDYVGDAAGNIYAATTDGEVIRGLGGADSVTGSGGADAIFGGTGLDTVFGGMGADTIDVGAGDGADDTVVYADLGEGAQAGASTGHDFIQGFLAGEGNDLIRIVGDAAAGIDKSVDNAIEFLTDAVGVDFTDTTEAVLLTSAYTGLDDADLVAPGFTDLLDVLDMVLADAFTGEDGLLVVQGSSDTGVYYFVEDGDAGHVAGELTLLAIIDNAALVMDNFQIVTPVE